MHKSRSAIGSLLALLYLSISAAAHDVHRFWGTQALWGYWQFNSDYVPKNDWKIASVTQEGEGNDKATNLIDDNATTVYHAVGKDSYQVVIDLGKSYDLGAFTMLTMNKPNPQQDSRIGKYELRVGDAPDNGGNPVAQGNFEGDMGQETVVTFPTAHGRYVALTAYPRPTANNKEVVIPELSLVEAATVKQYQATSQAEAGARQTRWQNRNTPATVEALGKEFLDGIYCTQRDLIDANIMARDNLQAIGKLRDAGQYAEGLKSFRDYYFDKLRRPQAFGIAATDVHLYGRGFAGLGGFPQGAVDTNQDSTALRQAIPAADDLMKGISTLGGKKVNIGEPGSVDWEAPGPPYGYTTPSGASQPYSELVNGSALQPLYSAYIVTKNEAYLKRWLDYMDDWAMNAKFLTELHPIFNADNSIYPVVSTIRQIAGIANNLPFDSEAVSPATLARIMQKLVTDSVLNDTVYLRSNPAAWTPGPKTMLFAILTDEFKLAPLYFRESRRRSVEDVNYTQGLRDGADDHQWPGYNRVLLSNAASIRLMDARNTAPDWSQPIWEKELHTPEWQEEERDYLNKRARFLIHWVTPEGEYPLITHHEPPDERSVLREAYQMVPTALDDPTTAKIYSTLVGDGSKGLPDYTSEWYPYAGYSIARTGWKPTDGYGAMFCSPHPGVGSVGSECKNNAFALSMYGLNMLGDDIIYSHNRVTSPIQVDNKRQNLDYNIYTSEWPSAHKGQMVTAWTEPSPWRWHASANFNLMEGVYAGVYANDVNNRKDFVDDVLHQRLALFSRRHNLWIITDRMLTPKKHDYEQLWWLPLQKAEKKDTAAFKPEEIVADDATHTIKTKRTESNTWWNWGRLSNITVSNANVSLYQFTNAALKYSALAKPTSDKNWAYGEEMYDWERVGVSWQGAGNQQIVTAIFPRQPTGAGVTPNGTENDLTSIHALKVGPVDAGFEAVTPDGAHLIFLAAPSQSGALAANGIKLTGEALLVVKEASAGADVTGMALGCKELTVNGKSVHVTHPDFEFTLPAAPNATLKMAPIYRPISPVQVLPATNAFAEHQQVTLKSDTPDVFMTYTFDGTEPTPQSTLYKAPFVVDHSVVVKARAYRPGVTQNPLTESGTEATSTSLARYEQKLWQPAAQVSPGAAGLNYEYYEGLWKDLWLALDKQTPKTKGTVTSLFDMSVIPETNHWMSAQLAPREKTYAFRYTGFLNVPTDGIYTFQAPREYVYPDSMAGYELRVYVGHASYNDAGVIRQRREQNYWYPATRLHAHGNWSVPLKKGYHEFRVEYIDFRMDGPKRLNKGGGIKDYVWNGEKPDLRISGPGLTSQPIPAAWLAH